MWKKIMILMFTCFVFFISSFLMKVNAFSYYGMDYGDFESYADSDYGYHTEYTIRDYVYAANPLFGSNAYYESIQFPTNAGICCYIQDDDPIINYIPKSLFSNKGETTFVGKEYGFHVDCHDLEHLTGSYTDNIFEIDVFIFDITIGAINNTIDFLVEPLCVYTYIYIDKSAANRGITGEIGVLLPRGSDKIWYYMHAMDTSENNNKASKEGLVVPYPYSDLWIHSTQRDYCSRLAAMRNEDNYAIEDIYNYVYVENINSYNIYDTNYVLAEDMGFAFKDGYIEYAGGQPIDKPLSQEQFLNNGIKNICYSLFQDEASEEIIETDDMVYLEIIMDLIELAKDNGENNKAIEEYIKNPFNKNSNSQYFFRPDGATYGSRAEDIIDGELAKCMFFYFQGDEENENTLITANEMENEYCYFNYEGYFPDDIEQETLIKYILEITIAKKKKDGTFENVSSDMIEETMLLYNDDTATKLSLSEGEDTLSYNGYFIEGFSETIKFDVEKDGIYAFEILDFNLEVFKNGINLEADEYEFVEGDVITLVVFHNENYGEFLLKIIRIPEQEFNLITDPDYDRSGTEFKKYPNENKSIIHVGYTRLLFLGDNAPIDIYDSRLDYEWISDSCNIATVSKYGTVFAKDTGFVTITVSIKNRYTAEIQFLIVDIEETDEVYSFNIALDVSEDTNIPNGTILNYVPTDEELELGYDFGAGGFDIKYGYTRCIFISDGPSKYRQDYDYEIDMVWGESLLPLRVSQYGTIILNYNVRGYIISANIICTYKYNSSYRCTFTVRLIGV